MTDRLCAHEGSSWARLFGPTEMVETECAHDLGCPVCNFRVHVFPCEHAFTAAPPGLPGSYRIAVHGPTEIR